MFNYASWQAVCEILIKFNALLSYPASLTRLVLILINIVARKGFVFNLLAHWRHIKYLKSYTNKARLKRLSSQFSCTKHNTNSDMKNYSERCRPCRNTNRKCYNCRLYCQNTRKRGLTFRTNSFRQRSIEGSSERSIKRPSSERSIERPSSERSIERP